MPAVIKNKLLLYADDSAILVSAKNKKDIECLLSEDLHIVSEWLISNKLSLHLGKTESILFGSKQRLKSQSQLNIKYNEHSIESKTSVKYLGATLDQSLSFETMARSVIQKSNARLNCLYRKSQYLTQHTKTLLIVSLIQCHFDYASSAWFPGLTRELKHKLQVTQNKLIRFIFNLNPRSHIDKEHFVRLNWLPVASRVNQIILCHVFKMNSNISPAYMKENFTAVNSVHQYPTRFSVNVSSTLGNKDYRYSDSKRFAIPKVKGFGKHSFAYNGCTLWNSLPQNIRDATNISSFKNKAKEHLISTI